MEEVKTTFDVVKTTAPAQTQKVAADLAGELKGGEVVALFGDLGAGKTVFVKGLAKGLGITRRVLSPTFVFMRPYQLTRAGKNLIFYHIDLFRSQNIDDFKLLGLAEIFSANSIVAIEWADKIKSLLPKKRIDILLEKVDEKIRKIIIKKN